MSFITYEPVWINDPLFHEEGGPARPMEEGETTEEGILRAALEEEGEEAPEVGAEAAGAMRCDDEPRLLLLPPPREEAPESKATSDLPTMMMHPRP